MNNFNKGTCMYYPISNEKQLAWINSLNQTASLNQIWMFICLFFISSISVLLNYIELSGALLYTIRTKSTKLTFLDEYMFYFQWFASCNCILLHQLQIRCIMPQSDSVGKAECAVRGWSLRACKTLYRLGHPLTVQRRQYAHSETSLFGISFYTKKYFLYWFRRIINLDVHRTRLDSWWKLAFIC